MFEEVEPEAEYLFLDAAFAVKGGLRTTLEIIHLLTSQPVWDRQHWRGSRDIYRMFELNTQRNLELLTHDKVNHAVFGDRRLMDPSRGGALQAHPRRCRRRGGGAG